MYYYCIIKSGAYDHHELYPSQEQGLGPMRTMSCEHCLATLSWLRPWQSGPSYHLILIRHAFGCGIFRLFVRTVDISPCHRRVVPGSNELVHRPLYHFTHTSTCLLDKDSSSAINRKSAKRETPIKQGTSFGQPKLIFLGPLSVPSASSPDTCRWVVVVVHEKGGSFSSWRLEAVERCCRGRFHITARGMSPSFYGSWRKVRSEKG